MYKEGVTKVQVAKYKKASSQILQQVFASKFHYRSGDKKG